MGDTTAQAVDDFDAATSLILTQQTEEPEEETLEADAEEQATEDDPEDDAEAEDAEAEDAEDDSEDDAEDDPEPEPLHTVKVNGEQKQVTLDELKRGYSGQEYIQQQMRQVAEGRREVEGIYAALQSEVQQVSALRQRLETGGIPQQPKPPSRELFEVDPIGFVQARIDYEEDLTAWEQTANEYASLQQRNEQMQQQALQYQIAQEMQKLQQAIPEFADKAQAAKIRDAVLNTGQEYGYSPEELSSVTDSRAVRVLHDAMKYRQMLAARGQVQKKVEGARPVVKPGAKSSPTIGKAKQAKQVASRMKTTGNVDDVAKFLLS